MARWLTTLLVFGSVVLGSGCSDFYTVRGRVRSCADHAPVAHASVHLTQKDERGAASTDVDGAYRVAVNDPPNDAPAELKVQKEGYQTLTKEVHHSLELAEDVCIDPIGKR